MGRVFRFAAAALVGLPTGIGLIPEEAPALDPTAVMPVDEVRAGQEAIGLSVFQGTRPDTFGIEILGVLEHVGPGRNLILGKARGELLEKTGIIAGMSGSPVYVEGRLIGAMAYAWTFAKEPVVGITPIGEMLELVEQSERSQRLGLGEFPHGGRRVALGDAAEPLLASEVRPIQTPVVLSGFAGRTRRAWQSFLAPLGFMGVEGGGEAPEDTGTDLAPGRAMGIQMVRGDATVTAIGTVTWADGERILGFGHPLLMAGPVSLPLSTAYIHTVLPSQVSSFKIGAPGRSVGAIREDRQAGLVGVLGMDVPMLPVSVTVTSGVGGHSDRYQYEIVRSDILTASLVGLVGYSSVEAAQKSIGESTLDIRTDIRIRGGRTLSSEVAVSTPAPPLVLSEQMARPIQILVENPFEKVEIEGIDVRVEVVDRFRVAEIADLRIDRARVRPGEEVKVWVTLKPYREPEVVEQVTVRIPPGALEGKVDLVACASADLWEMESERAPLRFEPTDLDQLVELLGRLRDTRRVYLQVFRQQSGKVVDGRELPRLPGSVLSVLDSGIRTGRTGPSAGAVLVERDIETEWVVVGCKGMKIEVRSR